MTSRSPWLASRSTAHYTAYLNLTLSTVRLKRLHEVELSTDQGSLSVQPFAKRAVRRNFDAYWELDFLARETFIEPKGRGQATALICTPCRSLTAKSPAYYMNCRTAKPAARRRTKRKNQSSTLELTDAACRGRGTDFDSERARAQLNSTLATILPSKRRSPATSNRLAVLAGVAKLIEGELISLRFARSPGKID